MSEIYTMTSRMINQSKMLETVSHNMANVNTVGFKRQDMSFKSVLDQSQQPAEYQNTFAGTHSKHTNFEVGDIKITNNKFDVAIPSDGFFGIKRGENTLYTKDGQFTLNQTGQLVTLNGESVLGVDKQPIDIALDADVQITPQGVVKDLKNGATFGQIAVFDFEDNATLVQAGASSFASPNQANQLQEYNLMVGALEQSNINAIQESVKLTEVSRAYQSAAKLVKTFEDLESKVIKDLYKVQ